jgi:uncharacterized protein DUF3223
VGKVKPVTIGAVEFPSEKKAQEYFTAMLARYRDGETLNEEDTQFLRDALPRHPREKIGPGIERFFRDRAKHGTSCFYIEYVNGSIDDFSFKKCVTGREK